MLWVWCALSVSVCCGLLVSDMMIDGSKKHTVKPVFKWSHMGNG